MGAYKLIRAAERAGCVLVAEGENIRVKNIDSLSASLKEKIKDHKIKILIALNRDHQVRKEGFMVGVPDQVYFCSLNKICSVYIEQIDSIWEAWRETHINDRHQSIRIKVICADSSFEYVLLKAKGYLDFLKQKLK